MRFILNRKNNHNFYSVCKYGYGWLILFLWPISAFANRLNANGLQHFVSTLPVLILLLGLVYLIIIRPQTLNHQKHQAHLSNLALGDEVITTGGILGTIETIKDDFVYLLIADNVRIIVKKHHVSQVVPKGTRQNV